MTPRDPIITHLAAVHDGALAVARFYLDDDPANALEELQTVADAAEAAAGALRGLARERTS